MKELLQPIGFPALAEWLRYSEVVRQIMVDAYAEWSASDQLDIAIHENVLLLQIEHLRSHPAVSSGLVRRKLRVYGWIYKLETGELFNYNPIKQQFEKITRDYHAIPTIPHVADI